VDAVGIVFFARYFDLFHDGYVSFLRSGGIDLAEVIRRGEWAAPLIHVEADYLRPLRFGDDVSAEVVAADREGSRVRVFHRIDGPEGPCAVGRTDHLFVDAARFTRIDLPSAVQSCFDRVPALAQSPP
jgi:acyl-CoA thioesterase FadM